MSIQSNDAFGNLPPLPPLDPNGPPPLSPGAKPPLTRRQKQLDFLIGFLGWWLINGLATGCYFGVFALANSQAVGSASSDFLGLLAQAMNLVSCLWLMLNIAMIIVLAFKRPWVAIGVAAAYASLFIIGLCVGIFLLGFCFWAIAQYGG
jgi:hypothetical protein